MSQIEYISHEDFQEILQASFGCILAVIGMLDGEEEEAVAYCAPNTDLSIPSFGRKIHRLPQNTVWDWAVANGVGIKAVTIGDDATKRVWKYAVVPQSDAEHFLVKMRWG